MAASLAAIDVFTGRNKILSQDSDIIISTKKGWLKILQPALNLVPLTVYCGYKICVARISPAVNPFHGSTNEFITEFASTVGVPGICVPEV